MAAVLAKIFGENLVREREARGLSQPQLGKLVKKTGLTVHRWETAKTWPGPAEIEALARVFGVKAWDLLSPHRPNRKKMTDPRIREALGVIVGALGFRLAPSKH